jgi:hypothetical protein
MRGMSAGLCFLTQLAHAFQEATGFWKRHPPVAHA